MSGSNGGNALWLALLVIGVGLLIWASRTADSLASGVSRLFTGSPTDQTVWLIVGGLVACIVGAAGLLRGRSRV